MVLILSILLGIAVAVVLGILLAGVLIFARGGEANKRLGQRMMNLRVAAQAVAVALLGLLVLARGLGWR
jgi:hypothetical protein